MMYVEGLFVHKYWGRLSVDVVPVWYQHHLFLGSRADRCYHRLSQLGKELQLAAAPYFFIFPQLIVSEAGWKPVGNVVEDSSHE